MLHKEYIYFHLTPQSYLEPHSCFQMALSKVLVQCISMLATPCSMSQKVDLAFYDQSRTTLHLHIHSLHVLLSIVLCAFTFAQAWHNGKHRWSLWHLSLYIYLLVVILYRVNFSTWLFQCSWFIMLNNNKLQSPCLVLSPLCSRTSIG